jgi:hypothetical protein
VKGLRLTAGRCQHLFRPDQKALGLSGAVPAPPSRTAVLQRSELAAETSSHGLLHRAATGKLLEECEGSMQNPFGIKDYATKYKVLPAHRCARTTHQSGRSESSRVIWFIGKSRLWRFFGQQLRFRRQKA